MYNGGYSVTSIVEFIAAEGRNSSLRDPCFLQAYSAKVASMIDWQTIEGPEEQRLFNFGQQDSREEIGASLLIVNDPKRLAATEECIRIYSRYRKAASGRGFVVGLTGGHRKIRDSFASGASIMWQNETSPLLVLKYLSRPGVTRFAGGSGDLQVIPYTMMCSAGLINQAACARVGPATVKHAYSQEALGKTAGLRAQLEEKFGRDRIAAIAESDADLQVKVAERARQLRTNPTMFVPKAYREVVEWLAAEASR